MRRPTPILLGLFLAGVLSASDGKDGTRIVVRDGEVVRLDDDGGPTVIRVDRASRRRYLGVRPMELTPDLRAHYGAPRDAGVLIGEVEADSPAAKAGLQVGDIVTTADGEKIEAPGDLARAIRGTKAGEAVKLEVVRDKAVKHLSATVGERKTTETDWNESRPKMRARDFAMIPDFDFHWSDRDRDRLTDRLHELEDRLKELEKKLSR